MLKFSDNPPICFPDDVSSAPGQKRWWVAHTRSRHEKSLAQTLRQWEDAYFLPMVEKVRIRRNRKVRAAMPLFPGYVFFVGDENDRYRVMTTNRVANIIYVEDQDRLVSQMQQLKQALGGGAELKAHPFLAKGARCRITCGVFKGLEGVVQQNKQGGTYLVLQVHALGQAVAMEVDAGMVEPIT